MGHTRRAKCQTREESDGGELEGMTETLHVVQAKRKRTHLTLRWLQGSVLASFRHPRLQSSSPKPLLGVTITQGLDSGARGPTSTMSSRYVRYETDMRIPVLDFLLRFRCVEICNLCCLLDSRFEKAIGEIGQPTSHRDANHPHQNSSQKPQVSNYAIRASHLRTLGRILGVVLDPDATKGSYIGRTSVTRLYSDSIGIK